MLPVSLPPCPASITTRVTFNPRLRIRVLFPRLVGFAVEAIWEFVSATLLSALISGLISGAGASVVETAAIDERISTGVAVFVGGVTVADDGAVRVSFEAGCDDADVEPEVRAGLSAGEAVVAVVGEIGAVFDVKVCGAFSEGEAAAIVVVEVSAAAEGEVGDAFSVAGATFADFDDDVAGVDVEGRGCLSPDGTVVTVDAEAVVVDKGVVSAFRVPVVFAAAVESGIGV